MKQSLTDETATIQELKDLVVQFTKARHWEKHHTPKNLAMGIAIEAAELMEHYQWDNAGPPNPEEVADELSDVLFNMLNFAQRENIDITSSFMRKYEKILQKYPLEKFSNDRTDLDEYLKIKRAYRRKSSKT